MSGNNGFCPKQANSIFPTILLPQKWRCVMCSILLLYVCYIYSSFLHLYIPALLQSDDLLFKFLSLALLVYSLLILNRSPENRFLHLNLVSGYFTLFHFVPCFLVSEILCKLPTVPSHLGEMSSVKQPIK